MRVITLQGRQGDILIERIDAIPPGAKPTKERTVALGESQGHGHVLVAEPKTKMKVFVDAQEEDVFYCEAKGQAAMEHLMVSTGVWTGEHHPVSIPDGTYRISRQYQYDPYADAIEIVAD